MKNGAMGWAVVVVWGWGTWGAAWQGEIDYTLDETPARVAPAWVKMVDQGAKNPALAGIKTPEGIKVEIVAQEPVVVNPVGMKFADDGTPYVLEWKPAASGQHMPYEVTFKDGTKAVVNRMVKDAKDQLKTLADKDSDGRFDTATVLMDDLEIPSSLLLHDDWIYLSSIGHVVRRKPAQEKGKWEEEEIVRGLCGFHHHQASGLTMSPDGWLYVTSGDDDNHGEGSDGSRATVLRTGAIFRMKPDGSKLAEFARGFRNPYRDVVFDHTYNMFHVDNDQEDGSKFQGVRLMHVLEGADFGWRLVAGAVCCRTDFARGAVFGEAPGKMPSMLKTGRGSPAGLLIYQGTAFPEFFRGLLIYPDVYRKMVRAYSIEQAGSTFRVTGQFVLMQSDEGLFRPCQAVAGPDGAIYIVDWRTDSGGAGKLWGDGQHGRIYKLSWEGTADAPAIPLQPTNTWSALAKLDRPSLLKQLDTPDFEIRNRTLSLLCAAGEAVRPELLAVLANNNHPLPARAAALGGACRFWNDDVQTALLKVLRQSTEADLQRLAAAALGHHVNTPSAAVMNDLQLLVIQSKSPAVKRAAALALGQVASLLDANEPQRAQVAKLLWSAYLLSDKKDVYLADGILRGMERTGKTGMDWLSERIHKGPPLQREQAVAALQAMRTREAAEALDLLLRDEKLELSDELWARLLSIYRHILVEPPVSARAVSDWLAAHPQATVSVQLTGLETLGLVGGGDAEVTSQLALKLLGEDDASVRQTVIRSIGDAGLVAASQALVRALKDSNRSVMERREIVSALSKLRSRPLPFTGVKSPPGVELVLDELAAVAADEASADICGEALSLLSQVDYAKAEPVALKLLERGQPQSVSAAIDVLGATPDRAKQLGRRFVDGKLPRTLLPQVAAALQKHVEKDASGECRRLLNEAFKGGLLVSLDPQEVQRVEELIRTQGNPQRGLSVYLNSTKSQCAKCHRLEGVGGQVGPDLSKIWETHNVAKIMESMIAPSKEIKEGFATWQVVTTGGQVYAGLKISENKTEIVLRDPEGKDIRLAQVDVDEKVQTTKSLMPEGVFAQLSYQEFIDLVSFLKDRTAQQSLRSILTPAWTTGPYSAGTQKADAPETLADPLKPGNNQPLAWKPLEIDSKLQLDLTSFGENSSSYVFSYLHSPREQTAELTVWFDDAAKVLVNGAVVHESDRVHTDETFKAPLRQGWNMLLVRVSNGAGPSGLKLSVKSGEGLRFSLQPKDELPVENKK